LETLLTIAGWLRDTFISIRQVALFAQFHFEGFCDRRADCQKSNRLRLEIILYSALLFQLGRVYHTVKKLPNSIVFIVLQKVFESFIRLNLISVLKLLTFSKLLMQNVTFFKFF